RRARMKAPLITKNQFAIDAKAGVLMRTIALRLFVALPVAALLVGCSLTTQTSIPLEPVNQRSSQMFRGPRPGTQPQYVYVTSTDEFVSAYDPQSNGYAVSVRDIAN